MKLEFKNKKITGILTVIPKNIVKFEDEIANYNFSSRQSMKLKIVMGYNEKRIVKEGTCSSDLCEFGLNYLFQNKLLNKADVDALIFVSQSPDYFMPPTSNLLQGKLGLKQDMLCMDIAQGCAGFIIGLIQAFMLLEQKGIKKVVLLNADVLSPKVSKKDRNSNPLIGDGAAITIIENSNSPNNITASLKMDGTNALCLNIPAGGFRLPSSAKTAEMQIDEAGNYRSLDNLVMKGDDVFNFVLEQVPDLIEQLLKEENIPKETIDYFMCHQPNKFMLQKLADKLKIPYEKMPNNIVEYFGNASGVTIPTNISFNLGEKLLHNRYKVCLAGFGVGLTWAAMILDIEKLSFNKLIDF